MLYKIASFLDPLSNSLLNKKINLFSWRFSWFVFLIQCKSDTYPLRLLLYIGRKNNKVLKICQKREILKIYRVMRSVLPVSFWMTSLNEVFGWPGLWFLWAGFQRYNLLVIYGPRIWSMPICCIWQNHCRWCFMWWLCELGLFHP